MMMLSLRTLIRWTLGLALVLLLAGCLSRQSPEVKYYGLLDMEQLASGSAASANHAEVKLGIGPISIPDSLKRSQILTREQGHLYRYDEFNRWAGLLESNVAMTLGDNLGLLLGIDKVVFYPWSPTFQPSYRVIVDIVRFDGDLAGEAVLSARWAVTDGKGTEALAWRKSTYRQALTAADYATLVRAESELLAALSAEIAAVLEQQVK